MTNNNKFIIIVLTALFVTGCALFNFPHAIEEKNCNRSHDFETYDYYVHTGAIVICKEPYKKTEWGEKIYANFYRQQGYEEVIYFVIGWEEPIINKLPKKYMERDTIYAIIACDRASYSARSIVDLFCIEELNYKPEIAYTYSIIEE